jgi:plastocyanin
MGDHIMKKFSYALLLLLLASLPAHAEDKKIDINNYMFAPNKITVTQGTKVTWVNHDEVPHTIASKDKKFRSPALDTDDTFSYTFTTPGTYEYFCTLHPQMVATITVAAK